ncbi:phage terminase small subunit P27 family [Terribacillus sp. 7520-G]|uniref:phage terminase small subunit P27 family n=1 Tax=Terribacillus sp. 7520-G TaxID=2025389 RepID=UPI000BA54FC7|nr:phage terminase small subunit P27 family [Terribacillus sp. 7520-G]PAD39851.1 hypothetical protein CHH53_03980 [Terribacillus sp. 7520-G]
MAGRKQKLLNASNKNLTKEEIAEREEVEQQLYEIEQLDPYTIPTFLDTRGKKEWKRVAPLLLDLPISELDRALLATYCSWYSIHQQAVLDIKKLGIKVEEKNSKGDIVSKQNPSINIMKNASSEIKSIAGQLGLSIDSRLRIIGSNKDDDDESDPVKGLI